MGFLEEILYGKHNRNDESSDYDLSDVSRKERKIRDRGYGYDSNSGRKLSYSECRDRNFENTSSHRD